MLAQVGMNRINKYLCPVGLAHCGIYMVSESQLVIQKNTQIPHHSHSFQIHFTHRIRAVYWRTSQRQCQHLALSRIQ